MDLTPFQFVFISGLCFGSRCLSNDAVDQSELSVPDSEVSDSEPEDMSCETGFTNMGTYCIQADEANSGDSLDWYTAWDYCVDNYAEARLCTFSEWYDACRNRVLTNDIDDDEWIDNWCEHGDVNVVGNKSCEDVERFEEASSNSHAFRCCKGS